MGTRGGPTAPPPSTTPADGGVVLRPCTPYDEPFLLRIYASTREAELAAVPWSAAEKDAFVRTQYDAQHRHYAAAYPAAERSVVEVDGRPAGRWYVDRSGDEIRLVDVSLLPEFRGRGVGTLLLRQLIAEAARSRRPLRLHVAEGNPARRLYLRLGFAPVRPADGYELMELLP